MTPEIKPAHPGRLPCVDGWRALSICLVLGAHSLAMTGFPGDNPLVSCFPLLVDGNLGVRFFFVISGFLITYLLIEEQARNGDISLTKFCIRRALRILPVYLMYLAVVAALLIPKAPGVGSDPDLTHHLEHAELAVVPGGSIAEY